MAQQAVFNSPPRIGPSTISTMKPAPVVASSHDIAVLENKLKKQTDTRRIRLAEYFGDFDPLRTGAITKDQFRRSMDNHLGISLSDRDYELLASKYSSDPKRVNYKQFVDNMVKEFDPVDFSQRTTLSTETEPTWQGKTTEFDDKAKILMQTCAQYYKSRGIRVKSCYQDFDRHNMGYITFSQFHRSFPGPPEIKESEISVIAECYLEPSTGIYNYLRFNSDIEVFQENEALKKKFNEPPKTFSQRGQPRSLEETLRCIRDFVFKNGIRTTEFFCDHDKLRSGLITENQFMCGLSLCLGEQLRLNREEIQRVVRHYQSPDGRVCYKEFCHLMENAYTAPNLEQNPDQQIKRPLQGQLHKGLTVLSIENERLLEDVLTRLSAVVRKRRLLLHTFFKDFDRSKGYTRGVTKSQFKRVLDYVGLSLTPQELQLIIKKFEDPVGGDVNYSAFIQAVDEEYTGHVIKEKIEQNPGQNTNTSECDAANEAVDVQGLLATIQSHVLGNRIRTCEHFQDFDPLRSGAISLSKFRQGLSSLGQPYLTDAEFRALCERYGHPKFTGSIAWKAFTNDIDEGFSEMPDASGSLFSTMIPAQAHDAQQQSTTLLAVIQRLKQRIAQRRIFIKPCFQDFDRHNMGYITKSQFRQCLSYLELPASEDEMILIESRFSNDKGFKYLEFLRELQPSDPEEKKYDQRLDTLVRDKLRVKEMRDFNETDNILELAEYVMERIKIKVSKERVRVLEFMADYDKLRCGRIPAPSFIRALDLCGFKLTPKEMNALAEKFRSDRDPHYVEYARFSDEIESIFTVKELEKMPTVHIEQFVPPEEVDLNQLTGRQERILKECIDKLAERVRVRRIQLFPLFEDYDRVNIGSVTISQFQRVLNELDLRGLLSDYEFSIIVHKFGVRVGGRTDVYYFAFCGMVEDCAQKQ